MHMLKTKISGGSFQRLASERERQLEHYKNYVDSDRSADNVIIKHYIQELDNYARSQGVNRIRKDAVGSLDFVMTMPQNETIDITDKEALTRWANDVITATCDAMSLDTRDLLGAVVHMDETTPHVHFSLMPLVRSQDSVTLSAKTIANKKSLTKLHDRVSEYMRAHGYEGQYVNDEAHRGLGKESLETFKHDQEYKKSLEQIGHTLDNIEHDLELVRVPDQVEIKKPIFSKTEIVKAEDLNKAVCDTRALLEQLKQLSDDLKKQIARERKKERDLQSYIDKSAKAQAKQLVNEAEKPYKRLYDFLAWTKYLEPIKEACNEFSEYVRLNPNRLEWYDRTKANEIFESRIYGPEEDPFNQVQVRDRGYER